MLATTALGCVIAGGCGAVLGIDDDVEVIQPSTSSGGAGGDASTVNAGSVGGSGSGGAAACTSPGECPGADLPCSVRTCLGGICGLEDKPGSTVVADQTPGDCKRKECDGAGNVIEVGDQEDFEDDGEDCTEDACNRGSTKHTPAEPGTPCGNGQTCNSTGKCACEEGVPDACGSPTACQTKACVGGVCVADNEPDGTACGDCHQCSQGQCKAVVDGTDLANDCGGCAACQAGACVDAPAGMPDPKGLCNQFDSCNGSGQCRCADGVKDGMEPDIDCGALCGVPCSIGDGCGAAPDCETKCCGGGVCGSCAAGCECVSPKTCQSGGICG